MVEVGEQRELFRVWVRWRLDKAASSAGQHQTSFGAGLQSERQPI